MQMIDVLKRLAELDSTNPNVQTIAMTNEQSLATVSNIESETITESVNECGPMGMMSSPASRTPASFSINASAESGDEVSSMLRDIMNLAGVKPVADLPAFAGHNEIELEPAHALELEPAQSAGDEMGDLIGMVDRMNGPSDDSSSDDLSVAHGDVDDDGDHDIADHEAEFGNQDGKKSPIADMADEVRDMADEMADEGVGAGFDTATTTPDEKVEPHKYGNDQVTPKPAEPLKKAGAGNPYTESVDQVTSSLLKAYEAFKNGQ